MVMHIAHHSQQAVKLRGTTATHAAMPMNPAWGGESNGAWPGG